MNNLVIRNILRFVFLLLLQILVLDNVYLGSYVSPYLFVLFVLMLPGNMPKMVLLLLAFATGLCMDIFSTMLGFHAAACTLVAFCRILFADRILTRGEAASVSTPCFYTVPFQQFLFYLLLLLFIYNFAFFLLEFFDFRDLWRVLMSTVCSTVVTGLLAIVYQYIFLRKKQ